MLEKANKAKTCKVMQLARKPEKKIYYPKKCYYAGLMSLITTND